VDTTELRPTASRESLYDDALLEQVREDLGQQLRGWMTRLGATNSARLGDFLRIHYLGVKALAVHDDEMLRLVEQWWPYETTVGPMTLAEFRDRHGVVRYVASVDEFRQIAAVASAQGLPVINAGYVYDAELLSRLPVLGPDVSVEAIGAADLTTQLDGLDPGVELALRPFLSMAQRVLDRFGVEVLVRAFDPVSLPALYLLDGETALHMDMRRGQEKVDEVWASILESFTVGRNDRPQLVLNHRNPLTRQATTIADADLAVLAVEGLYVQALLLGHQPLRPIDTAALNQSFLGLLGRAMRGSDRPAEA
jgi:molecular chaperone HtpG